MILHLPYQIVLNRERDKNVSDKPKFPGGIMNKKKILAAKAIAALLLASSLPMTAEAASNLDMKDVHSARGGCGASSARGGCGAAPEQTPSQNGPRLPNQTPGAPTTPNTPKSGCGAQTYNTTRPSAGCGAQSNNQPRPSAGCGAQPYNQPRPSAGCGAQPYNQPRPSAGCGAANPNDDMMHTNAPSRDQMIQRHRQQNQMQNQGTTSTYQGTTTGPGPNGGYPETPRGTYRIQPNSRD
jgi:hypothetical protein